MMSMFADAFHVYTCNTVLAKMYTDTCNPAVSFAHPSKAATIRRTNYIMYSAPAAPNLEISPSH